MKLPHFPLAAAATAALMMIMTACGGGGSQGSDSSNGAPGSSNRAPTVSAPTSVETLAGREVVVKPAASDPEGQKLSFSITNQPSWATFDPATGELRGVPTAADIGTYTGIRITASDGSLKSSVQFDITVATVAVGRATLSWTAPAERTDGSVLTNLAGFRIYYGSAPYDLPYSVEIRDPGANSWVIEDLTQGTWYFAATAFDSAGVESMRTNAVSKTIG